jgi:hypothetical protein
MWPFLKAFSLSAWIRETVMSDGLNSEGKLFFLTGWFHGQDVEKACRPMAVSG